MLQNEEKPSNNMDKITQEKYNKSRERSDRISALMGQYMLKGYRMLGSTCEVCGVSIIGKIFGFVWELFKIYIFLFYDVLSW